MWGWWYHRLTADTYLGCIEGCQRILGDGRALSSVVGQMLSPGPAGRAKDTAIPHLDLNKWSVQGVHETGVKGVVSPKVQSRAQAQGREVGVMTEDSLCLIWSQQGQGSRSELLFPRKSGDKGPVGNKSKEGD